MADRRQGGVDLRQIENAISVDVFDFPKIEIAHAQLAGIGLGRDQQGQSLGPTQDGPVRIHPAAVLMKKRTSFLLAVHHRAGMFQDTGSFLFGQTPGRLQQA